MPITIGDVIRATAKMEWGGNDIQNVFHIQADASSAELDSVILDDVIADLDNAYSALVANLTTSFTFESVSVYNLTAGRYLGEDVWTTLTAGTDAATTALPIMVAALARFPTQTLGSQGRKFIAGWTTNDLGGFGELSASAFNATTLFATRILNGLTGTGWTGTHGNYQATPAVFRPYVRAVINTYWCTQRRRRPGVGS